MKALAMIHDVDPRRAIMEAAEPYLDGFEPLGAQVLVAIYQRPQRTASGLYLSDGVRTEDLWQGKCGLVLKMGPLAFVEDETHRFGDRVPKPGDWVVYRVGDSWPFLIEKTNCRFVEDVAIKAIVNRPDVVM
jgi:co-chaperonin GroES (HSP10)